MSRNSPETDCTLIVRGLVEGARIDELKDIFNEYGIVKEVCIPLDYYTKRQRGFAYVRFDDPRDAKDAYNYFMGEEYMGHELKIDVAKGHRKTPEEMSPGRRGTRSRQYYGHDRRSRRYLDDEDEEYRRRDRSKSRDRKKRSRSSSRSESPCKRRRHDIPESSKRHSMRDRSRSDSRCKRRGHMSPESPKTPPGNDKSRSGSKSSARLSDRGMSLKEKVISKIDCSKSPFKVSSPTADEENVQRGSSVSKTGKGKNTSPGSHEFRSRSKSGSNEFRSAERRCDSNSPCG